MTRGSDQLPGDHPPRGDARYFGMGTEIVSPRVRTLLTMRLMIRSIGFRPRSPRSGGAAERGTETINDKVRMRDNEPA